MLKFFFKLRNFVCSREHFYLVKFQHTLAVPVMHLDKNYQTAIATLNTLQSNLQYRQALNNKEKLSQSQTFNSLNDARKYLLRSGLSFEELDSLSVIHVTGTKGKGSICALTESILRHHGFKTGFYSSPHLLEVRERIRIDGIPISKNEFSDIFWKIYGALYEKKEHEFDLPLYFRMLTIMAFNIFVQRKVDVAIIEVGIGGEYDCTNILRKVGVVGITSIGLEHLSILGNSLTSIAWNKAGIMKPNCTAFTVPQRVEVMNVLRERSREKECKLEIVSSSDKNENCILPSIQSNIDMAVSLSSCWVSSNSKFDFRTLSDEVTNNAIKNCSWPGRYQTGNYENIKYFVDGAHTVESLEICLEWYANSTKNLARKKVLMFYLTGDRDCGRFFKIIAKENFGLIIFVPNVSTQSDNSQDTADKLMENEQRLRCIKYKKKWEEMQISNSKTQAEVFESVSDALSFLRGEESHNLLVTGSLYLVGAFLKLVDPDLNGSLNCYN